MPGERPQERSMTTGGHERPLLAAPLSVVTSIANRLYAA